MLWDVRDSRKAFSSIALMVAAYYEAGFYVYRDREEGADVHIDAASLGDLDGLKDVYTFRRSPSDKQTLSRGLNHISDLVTDDCMRLLERWALGQIDLAYS